MHQRYSLASKKRTGLLLAATAGCFFAHSNAGAATWTFLGGGGWGTADNWFQQVIPDGIGAVADFTTVDLTSDANVTLDANRTVGSIAFADTIPSNSWSISGGSLTFQNAGAAGAATGTTILTVNNTTLTFAAGTPIFNPTGSTMVYTGNGTVILTSVASGTGATGAGKIYITGGVTVQTGGSGSNFNCLSQTPTVTITDDITLDNGTLRYAGASVNQSQLRGIRLGSPTGFSMGTMSVLGSASLQLQGLWQNTAGGSGGLVKTGTGTLNFSTGTHAGNAWTGPTQILEGELLTNNIKDGGLTSGIGASTSDASNLVLNGGTLSYSGPTASTNRLFTVGPNNGTLEILGAGAGLNFTNTGAIALTGTDAPRTFTFASSAAANGASTFAPTIGNNGSGATKIVKNSTGALTLSGNHTYTGGTDLNNGALIVTGSLAATGTININGGATLAGRATVGSGTINGGATLRPGSTTADGSIGSITFTNAQINGDIRFDIASPTTSDLVNVTGVATFGGGSSVTVAGAPTQNGNYTVLSSAFNINYDAAPNLNAPSGGRATYALDSLTDPKKLLLVVSGNPFSLTWTGTAVAGPIWDVTNTTNWTNGTPQQFFQQDNVTFDDTSSNQTVQLDSNVTPTSMTVNTASTYTIAGSGNISGATTLNKLGSGTLVLATNNDLSGNITISAGTIRVGGGTNSGLIGSGAITNNGALILNRSDDLTVSNLISGTGSVRQAGTGVATLSGGNSYSGGLFVDSGSVRITSLGAQGSSTVTLNNGTLVSASIQLGANPIVFNGGTLGVTGNPAVLSSGELFVPAGTTSRIIAGDPGANGNQSNGTLTGAMHGSGTILLLANQGDTSTTDGGPGLRFSGVGSDFSGVIVVGNKVKAEMANSTASNSPWGTGKFIMTGGNFSGALGGNYSEINLRNNSTGDTFFGNDMEIVGTGRVVMNPLSAGAPSPNTGTLGNLKIGDQQILTVNKNGAGVNTTAFTSATLGGGTIGFEPTSSGGGWTGTASLIVGNIAETAPSNIVMSGQATFTMNGNNTYSGGTTMQSGTLVTSTNLSNGTLSVTGGTARVAQRTTNHELAGVTKVPALTVNGGTLDLTNNSLIVDYTAPDPSPLGDVRQQLSNAYQAGAWTGQGITSSTAATHNATADPNKRAVGYAEASSIGVTGSFHGKAFTGDAVLIAYTMSGDANLDGKVNALDFNAIAINFGTGNHWFLGDFNYDGNVNTDDFTIMGTNFNVSLPAAPPAPVLGSLVPEPGMLSILAMTAALATRRRRK